MYIYMSVLHSSRQKSEFIDGHHIEPTEQTNTSPRLPFTVLPQTTRPQVIHVCLQMTSLLSPFVRMFFFSLSKNVFSLQFYSNPRQVYFS